MQQKPSGKRFAGMENSENVGTAKFCTEYVPYKQNNDSDNRAV